MNEILDFAYQTLTSELQLELLSSGSFDIKIFTIFGCLTTTTLIRYHPITHVANRNYK
jgi:hypothetical protein